MATTEIPFLLGAAFLNQTTRGSATSMAAIGGGAGTGGAINNLVDGAVLGDPGAGSGESGIAISFGKNISEKAVLAGSFTRGFANFVTRTIEGFTIAVPMKGNGLTTTTPVGGDFTPDLGIAALYRAAGLVGGVSGALWRYTPTSALLATAALFFGNDGTNGLQVIVKDIEAESVAFQFEPGTPAVAEFALNGVFDSENETGSWPASPFEYGNQASLSAPAVESAAFTWGPSSPTARALGFKELSIQIDLAPQTVPSSNAVGGTVPRQSGRDVTITGIIDAAAADFSYELDQLAESLIANADPLSFTIGTPAGAAAVANAYAFNFSDPELISLEAPDPMGASQAWSIELKARSATVNGEMNLDYL